MSHGPKVTKTPSPTTEETTGMATSHGSKSPENALGVCSGLFSLLF